MDVYLPLVFLCVLSSALAFPYGGPKSACQSLMPNHSGIEVQKSVAPYVVSAVKSGNKIQVRISSPYGEEFEGFMLQARSNKDRSRIIDGMFTSREVSKTIDCFTGKKNTLTHVNANPKKEVVTEFTPSGNINEDVVIRATVAKTFSLFWTEVDSSAVHIISSGGSNTEMRNNNHPMYADCFSSKGCFGYPSGCIPRGGCELLLTYAKSSNGISFSMHGYLDPQMYMAMAFSTDKVMGDDSVTECVREDTRIVVRESWNEGKTNTRTQEFQRGSYKGNFINGLSTCSWVIPYEKESNGRRYNLADNTYYTLLAKGPMKEDGRLGYHASERISSLDGINFTALEEIVSEGVSEAVKIHGSTEETMGLPMTVMVTDDSVESTSDTDVSLKALTRYPLPTDDTTEEMENRSSQLSIDNLFLLVLLGFAFLASGKKFLGNSAL